MGLVLDEPKEDDRRYEAAGFTWVVASDEHDRLLGQQGIRVDHVSGWFGSGLVISQRGRFAARCC